MANVLPNKRCCINLLFHQVYSNDPFIFNSQCGADPLDPGFFTSQSYIVSLLSLQAPPALIIFHPSFPSPQKSNMSAPRKPISWPLNGPLKRLMEDVAVALFTVGVIRCSEIYQFTRSGVPIFIGI